uniref:Uncharacterized protein n=1 Tax=Rhizophagus irregularis (strain DAOM 181602 / DAOM 197198 / MUCL 43194) TaxID=747089 RepID=U9T211_RHIID
MVNLVCFISLIIGYLIEGLCDEEKEKILEILLIAILVSFVSGVEFFLENDEIATMLGLLLMITGYFVEVVEGRSWLKLLIFQGQGSKDLYKWQIENNPKETFILHDEPPYANGNLHIVLHGYKVKMRLSIELKALKELRGIDKSSLTPLQIRDVAKKSALEALEIQGKEFINNEYEVRQLQVFHNMMKKGYIHRQNKPVHWFPSSSNQKVGCITKNSWNRIELNIKFTFKGQQLIGTTYILPIRGKQCKIIDVYHITKESGLVHIAPDHGMEDYEACKNPPFCPVDEFGDKQMECLW